MLCSIQVIVKEMEQFTLNEREREREREGDGKLGTK
jgi:hypothetical protein